MKHKPVDIYRKIDMPIWRRLQGLLNFLVFVRLQSTLVPSGPERRVYAALHKAMHGGGDEET